MTVSTHASCDTSCKALGGAGGEPCLERGGLRDYRATQGNNRATQGNNRAGIPPYKGPMGQGPWAPRPHLRPGPEPNGPWAQTGPMGPGPKPALGPMGLGQMILIEAYGCRRFVCFFVIRHVSLFTECLLLCFGRAIGVIIIPSFVCSGHGIISGMFICCLMLM